jgi:predicted nucleotidyltransferase
MLNPDYRDILSAFNAESVEFLLVGAYALAAHGAPRATGDLDLWIRPSTDNAQRAWRALVRFGAPLEGLQQTDFSTPGTVIQIGREPRRIDLLTTIDGVGFDEAWGAKREIQVDGMTIPVIGRDEFLRNKRATGRHKDLADVERLEAGGGADPQ